MRILVGMVLTAVVVAGCSSDEEPDMTTSPIDIGPASTMAEGSGSTTPSLSTGQGSLVCWSSPTSGVAGAIEFTESTESMGLVTPLIGLHGHAAAFGDADGDQFWDLLVGTFGTRRVDRYQVRGADGPNPDQLLVGPAPFSESFGLTDELGRTSGAVFADFDGDGEDDLLLVRHAGLDRSSDTPSRLYRSGASGLTPVEDPLPADFLGRTPAVADFDGDGLLDIYVSEDKYGSYGGILLANRGDMVFSDVTAGSGLVDARALGAATGDLNGDGVADLVTSRQIFLGLGDLTFREITPDGYLEPPLNDEDDPAGVALGDLNRDGVPEIIVGQHNRSTVDKGKEDNVRLFAAADPENADNPVYEEVAGAFEPFPTLAPHVFVADIDNDGWPDVITSASAAKGAAPAIFRNSGSGDYQFESIVGLGSDQYWVGVPTADLNRDGKLDLFALEWEPSLPSLAFINSGSTGHWLEVSIDGPGRGVGAVVTIKTDGNTLGKQEIGVDGGYASGHLPIAHFGLGSVEEVDVQIELPDGGTYDLPDMQADSHIRWPSGCS